MQPVTWARQRCASALVAAGMTASLLPLMASAPAAAAPRPPAKVPVPQGIATAALTTASVFGTTSPATPETVSFILKARHLGLLEAGVEAGMPGGYLSVRQFARRFGQPASSLSALERYLSRYGIRASAYPDGLDVTATGTAGQFDAALSVQQHQYRVPAVPARHGRPGHPAVTIHGTTSPALLPRGVARFVLSVLGLTSYPAFASSAVRVPALAPGARPAARPGDLTPEDFARRYHLSPLQRRGATGAGVTVGIVTLASLNPSDPERFWKDVLHIATPAGRISTVNVDGGAGPVSLAAGSEETALDVEQAGAIASRAHIVVYQAPNADDGFVDAFYAAASQNVAATVSTSWEESETAIQASVDSGATSATYAVSFDDAYLELAAQGESAFAAAGDFGAYDAVGDLGSANLSIANPEDSPWITSAGGTTLPGTIPLTSKVSARIGAQRTWGWDWLWPYYALFTDPATNAPYSSEAAFAEAMPYGGGGGYSVMEPSPGYQQSVPGTGRFTATEYLAPAGFTRTDGLLLPSGWVFHPVPLITTGLGSGRATPDVVADADPYTGYELYCTEFSGDPLEDGWGGTSFVAPQLNGATAVIDSLLGRRVGFWNPAIYRFAAGGRSPFTPLDATGPGNDNLYFTGTPGHVFNPGSGLGIPDLARLAADFATG